MRTSPRRPLILKRRKLSLPVEDAAASSHSDAKDETDGRSNAVPSGRHPIDTQTDPQKFPAGIKIVNHPTMPNTQVVLIPKHANVQSIIAALTAKGKECGSTGPNKFILISGGGTLRPPFPQVTQDTVDRDPSVGDGGLGKTAIEDNTCVPVDREGVGKENEMLLQSVKQHLAPKAHANIEENNTGGSASCALDESLTNIQWLGKMSSDGLGSCSARHEQNKENKPPEPEDSRREEDISLLPGGSSLSSWNESISERPPYSYMAMIQFAINSTDRKRMTLKEIYTWIEDHFPYFKHIAKPGWKNSIRHNLSLHDMFVRETSANGKISFWTIHPDANRCLTLDQVFKPLDPGAPMQVHSCEPQQKRFLPELQKTMPGSSAMKVEGVGNSGVAERKMKLLLPRVNSYFVPIHFPLNQPFLQQPPGKTLVSSASVSSVSTADVTKSNKRVQIAPKATVHGQHTPPLLPIPSNKADTVAIKEETPTVATKEEADDTPLSSFREKISYTALKSPAWKMSDMEIPSTKEDTVAVKEEPMSAEVKAGDQAPQGSCSKEKIPYTAWKMPDLQASMHDDGPSPFLPHLSVKEESPFVVKKDCRFTVLREDGPLSSWKEERTFTTKSPAQKIPEMQVIRRRSNGSRRKQHLGIPCVEEPLLVFPECSHSDSGVVSDFSFLQETQAMEPTTDLSSNQETCSFKTPIKQKDLKLPSSSTPRRPFGTDAQTGVSEPWRVTSLNKEAGLPDFSPVRLPQGTTLTPFKDSLDLLGFNSPPFNDIPLFDSPQQVRNNKSPEIASGPFTSSPTFEPLSAKRCSKELQIGSCTNRSLTEGLVLDTMNDSLSKILLDISFTGLEDDEDYDGDNVSWSQLIPELR